MDTAKTNQLTRSRIDQVFSLSGNRWIYWLLGSFAVPFLIVAIVTAIAMRVFLESNLPPLSSMIAACSLYGLLAGLLGLIAIGISFLARRYWFLLAAFTIPMLMIGGFWGSWGWAKYCDDIVRSSASQQPRDVGVWQEAKEWASFVISGCSEVGLLPGFAIGSIVLLVYLTKHKSSN